MMVVITGVAEAGREEKKKKEEGGSRSRTLEPVRGEGYEPAALSWVPVEPIQRREEDTERCLQ